MEKVGCCIAPVVGVVVDDVAGIVGVGAGDQDGTADFDRDFVDGFGVVDVVGVRYRVHVRVCVQKG